MANQWPVAESIPTKTVFAGNDVVKPAGSVPRFSPPPMQSAFTRPASCDSRDLTWVSTTAGTVLQSDLIYQSFQNSTLITAGTECFPPGFQWTDSDTEPFYFSPGACPSGYTDAGGTTVLASGSVNYESFCCPTSFKSYGKGCWSAMTDSNRPIVEVVLQTIISVVSGTTVTGMIVDTISEFTQSSIYDNENGLGPFSTGFPIYAFPVRARTSTLSHYNSLHARALGKSKHIGALPLATFIGLMIGLVILLCCCCCLCNSNTGGSTYTPPPTSSARRNTYHTSNSAPRRNTYQPNSAPRKTTYQPSYSSYTAPPVRNSAPSYSAPVRVERPKAAVLTKTPIKSSAPEPNSYPPVRK